MSLEVINWRRGGGK